MNEKIIGAAVISSNGDMFAMAPPARHGDVIRYMVTQGRKSQEVFDAEQGFVTSTCRFVNRQEAYQIAKENGQLIRPEIDHIPGTLFSENVW